MDSRFQKLIKPIIIFAAIIFVISWLIKKPETAEDYWSYISYAITGVSLLFVLYERFLWRYIPWNRPPVLQKKYDGKLYYSYKKDEGSKGIHITVKQTLFSVQIKTKTDINQSTSVVGSLTQEFGEDILYYTYITTPSAATQAKNPIQHGTCRMIIDKDSGSIHGKYFTSSQTVGDIEWVENG